jgi:hypothetical protein
MALPLSWVDRIFDKLMLVYGRDFTGRWEGLPMSSVKDDWAHELSGFEAHPEAIKHALLSLNPAKPPTVLEFRNLAANAPKMAKIELPPPPVDKVFRQSLVAKLGAITAGGPKEWAETLRRRHVACERLNANQVRCYRLALGIEGA